MTEREANLSLRTGLLEMVGYILPRLISGHAGHMVAQGDSLVERLVWFAGKRPGQVRMAGEHLAADCSWRARF